MTKVFKYIKKFSSSIYENIYARLEAKGMWLQDI